MSAPTHTRFRTAPRRVAALVVGGAIVLTACGGTDDDSAAATEPVDAAATTAVPAPDGPPPDGGTTSADPNTLPDPSTLSGERSGQVESATGDWVTDWSRRTVGLDELLVGIPTSDPRDVIPPIDQPVYEPIAEADWLEPQEPGALVQSDGVTRFYPLSIMTRHEIVNDTFNGRPVAVTYCPLCNTAVTFDRRVDGETLRFGVSGLLRNSDLVMWDDATTSLWQQISGEGIVGRYAGTLLELIPTSIVSYGDVLENFPEAESLSRDLGFGIDYGANPYVAYSSSATPFLFDGEPDPRFPALSRVVGVTLRDESGSTVEKAYPFEFLVGNPAINDEVAGVPVAVLWGGDTTDALDAASIAESEAIGTGIAFDRRIGDETLTFSANDDDTFTDAETGSTWTVLGVATDGPLAGEQLTTLTHRNEFWFAWASFFPDAEVWSP